MLTRIFNSFSNMNINEVFFFIVCYFNGILISLYRLNKYAAWTNNLSDLTNL